MERSKTMLRSLRPNHRDAGCTYRRSEIVGALRKKAPAVVWHSVNETGGRAFRVEDFVLARDRDAEMSDTIDEILRAEQRAGNAETVPDRDVVVANKLAVGERQAPRHRRDA